MVFSSHIASNSYLKSLAKDPLAGENITVDNFRIFLFAYKNKIGHGEILIQYLQC